MAGYGSQGIQGHHLFVQELMEDFGDQFSQLLPGWDVNGEYNLAARASNNKIAAQLKIGMHLASVEWVKPTSSFSNAQPLTL
jgi:hypothetical protein